MNPMNKPLALCSIVFVTMALTFWHPSLAWLNPLSILILLFGTTWLWRVEGYSLYDLGLHRVASWHRNVFLGISIGLVLPTSLAVAQTATGWITLVPASWSLANLLGAVTKAILVVAVEELVFRGYFLQHFSFTRGTKQAILLSSLLWAFLHLPNMVSSGISLTSLAMGMITFVLIGVALSIGFLRTDNTLWLPLSLHLSYNLSYSFLGVFAAATYHAPPWLVGHPAWAPESGLLGVLLASATLMTIRWTTVQNARIKHSEENRQTLPNTA